MRERLEARLEGLRAEMAAGRRALQELELKEASLRDTVLRISGAVQVLEEELARSPGLDGGTGPQCPEGGLPPAVDPTGAPGHP